MTHHDVGDKPRLMITYATSAGVAADPTLVVLTVRSPSGLTTPSVTNPTVGTYYADVSLTASGTWAYKWQATGAIEESTEAEFYVRERLV